MTRQKKPLVLVAIHVSYQRQSVIVDKRHRQQQQQRSGISPLRLAGAARIVHVFEGARGEEEGGGEANRTIQGRLADLSNWI